MAEPILSVNDLSTGYGDFQALFGVSLDLDCLGLGRACDDHRGDERRAGRLGALAGHGRRPPRVGVVLVLDADHRELDLGLEQPQGGALGVRVAAVEVLAEHPRELGAMDIGEHEGRALRRASELDPRQQRSSHAPALWTGPLHRSPRTRLARSTRMKVHVDPTPPRSLVVRAAHARAGHLRGPAPVSRVFHSVGR